MVSRIEPSSMDFGQYWYTLRCEFVLLQHSFVCREVAAEIVRNLVIKGIDVTRCKEKVMALGQVTDFADHGPKAAVSCVTFVQ